MKIAVDIDGVIVDLVSVMLPLLSRSCRREVTHKDIVHFDIGKALNIPQEEMGSVWEEIWNGNYIIDAPSIPGSIEGLKQLRKHDLYINTARPNLEKVCTDTKTWFDDRNLDWVNIVFNRQGEKHLFDTYDYFVEDNPSQAINIANTGMKVLLFEQPWNKNVVSHNNCIYVSHWQDIVHIIDSENH